MARFRGMYALQKFSSVHASFHDHTKSAASPAEDQFRDLRTLAA